MGVWFGSVAELPGRPRLTVFGGADRVVEVGAVALDDGGIAHGRFVDHGHAADEAIFDLDVNWDEILEDDAARRVGAGYVYLKAP